MKKQVWHSVNVLALILLACISLPSCDKVKGPGPSSSLIPDSIGRLVSAKYPNASDLVMKTVVEHELWEARFTEDGVQYYLGLNPKKIVSEQRLIGPALPDSIESVFRNSIPIKLDDAVFSDYREDLTNRITWETSEPMYSVKLTTGGKEYLVYWIRPYRYASPSARPYLWWLIPYVKFFYTSNNSTSAEVPGVLSNFAAGKGFSTSMFWAWIFGDNSTQFMVNDCCNNFIIDQGGRILRSTQNVEPITSMDGFPETVVRHLSNMIPHIDDFQLIGPENYKFTDGGASGYSIRIKDDPASEEGGFAEVNACFDRDFKLTRLELSGQASPRQ